MTIDFRVNRELIYYFLLTYILTYLLTYLLTYHDSLLYLKSDVAQ